MVTRAEADLGTISLIRRTEVSRAVLLGVLRETRCWREHVPHSRPWRPCQELVMLAQVMEVWHGIVIAVVSLILQACLLAVINYLLSRHMAKENERILKGVRSQAPSFSSTHCCPPAAKERKETRAEKNVLVPEPRYRHDSDTSSDSSDSSDSSPSTNCQVTKDVNYTQVVFADPGGRRNDSVLDYENIKEATDYVNVNPKSHKPNFWTFVNPAVSEPVEYTQVVM